MQAPVPRFAIGLAMGAALLTSGGSSLAAPPEARRTVDLIVERPDGLEACPDVSAMRDLIAARLGYDPVVAGDTTTLVVSFANDGTTLRATLERRSAGEKRGSRVLRSETGDCGELGSSVALAAALAIDPESKARPTAPAPAPPPPPTPAKPPPPASRTPDRPAPAAPAPREPPTPTRLAVGLGPVVGAGHVPGVSVGPRLDVALRHGVFSFEVQGTALAEGVASVPAGEVAASAFFASVLPCLRWTAGDAWSGDACGEAQLGGVFASAESVDRSRPTTEVLGAAGPRASLELALGAHVAARLSTSVVAHLSRVHLLIDDAGTQVEVWSTPPVAFLVALEPVFLVP
jgi:hypothetical protein